ncbi:fimbrial protein [Trabulsiella odontotermitis]|uniref:fimbrial protein n=1 Tax=Trabulsiella odontotermitis TaxID=379893 RepID=UPI00092CF790|nr:fimbrial protein [Trabulsiella odontotermitis]
MKSRLLFLIALCVLMPIRFAQAYMVTSDSTEEHCIPSTGSDVRGGIYAGALVQIQSNAFLNLADGQYLTASGAAGHYHTDFEHKLSLRCDNLGKPQSSVVFKAEVAASPALISVNKSSILNMAGVSPDDESPTATLVRTNIQGLYQLIVLVQDNPVNFYVPSRATYSSTFSLSGLKGYNNYVVDNTFRGMPEGVTLIPAVSQVRVTISDDNEQSHDGVKGKADYIIDLPSESKPVVKITSTCQYTLSNSGSIDFGDQRVSQVTDDRNTTIKRTMTLNMDNCFGVNKVRTYITTTAPTAESGLLLGNNVADGAKNVAVALRVNKDYNESGTAGDNAGKDMYFDSSNPLEWNFGNAYTVTSLSKHIPLDVYLMRNGGEPTPGDYHTTATIMMDFI